MFKRTTFYSDLLYDIALIYLFKYLFIYFKVVVYFIVNVWCVLSCEYTCTMTQHYKAFQCYIITAIKHMAIKLILSYLINAQKL